MGIRTSPNRFSTLPIYQTPRFYTGFWQSGGRPLVVTFG
jgi:hypothetical protein